MIFEYGEFLKLPKDIILEVVYADEEKAVCLKMKKCHKIGYTYIGKCIVVSNRDCDYDGFPKEIEKVPNVVVQGKYHWEPLKSISIFPMV